MTLQIWDLNQNSNGLSRKSKKVETSSDKLNVNQLLTEERRRRIAP